MIRNINCDMRVRLTLEIDKIKEFYIHAHNVLKYNPLRLTQVA